MHKPLFTREQNCYLGSLLGQLPLPTALMDLGSKNQGPNQAKGVRQLLGQGESRVALREGLIWIAQKPQAPGSCVGPAYHLGVKPAIEKGQGAVLVGIIEGNHLLEVFSRTSSFSQISQGGLQRIVCFHQERRILYVLGETEALLTQLLRRL
jgi:hypothetical protein